MTVTVPDGGPVSLDTLARLRTALTNSGDRALAVDVRGRALRSVGFKANVRLDPAYRWEEVKGRIEAALWTEFGFERRDLARPMWRSELVAAVQRVPGVTGVDVVAFGAAAEGDNDPKVAAALAALSAVKPEERTEVVLARPMRLDLRTGEIRPAELAVLNPTLPGTLALSEWKRKS